jgi:ABC-2 type transport system ATP-binding protein
VDRCGFKGLDSVNDSAFRLRIENLSKSYGDTAALEGVSLCAREGEVVGLIGPDGAGKTTLMRIVCGLLLPDTGLAEIMGYDCVREERKVKEHLGYMPQRFSLYQDLTVAENLRFFADLFGVGHEERRKREEQLMGFSGLGPFRDRRAGDLSGGMKQKLALSCTLIHTPDVLVLDEPTTGVDVESRSEFWKILDGLARDGLTLLVSTPYMDEATRFPRVVLLHRGRIIASGAPGEVTRQFKNELLEVVGPDAQKAWRLLKEGRPKGAQVLRFGDRLHVVLEAGDRGEDVRGQLSSLDVCVERISPTIEDTFVALMGEREGSGG